MQLEPYKPEDKSLAPIEISESQFQDYLAGKTKVKLETILEKELTQELISRIENSEPEFVKRIKEKINKTGKCPRRYEDESCKKIYYEMIYLILRHHRFGYAGKSKLKRISLSYFAMEFKMNRGTLSSNLDYVDFYKDKKFPFPELKPVFEKIEDRIIK